MTLAPLLIAAYVWTAKPDPLLTPGMVNPECTIEMICPHSRNPRDVNDRTKEFVLREYGRTDFCHRNRCEVDHLIPLELCGSNDIRNLWAQPPPDWQAKDIFENIYHRAVCAGKMTLPAAQDAILHFYNTQDDVFLWIQNEWHKVISVQDSNSDGGTTP